MTTEDWIKEFFESGVRFDPGTEFAYNSMNTYMLSAVVKERAGMGLMQFLRPRLFVPLGIERVHWETCPRGIEKGGWGALSLSGRYGKNRTADATKRDLGKTAA